MENLDNSDVSIRVHYRLIEAAIRWSGLLQFESKILELARSGPLPARADIPGWARLRLNADRIRDGLINDELKYGLNGVRRHDPSLLEHPDLTVRHVDLKAWMREFYPDQRPAFLFDAIERHLHPSITIEAVQALVADRDSLRVQLDHHKTVLAKLRAESRAVSTAQATSARDGPSIGARSERTYLNIIGGLLWLLLGTAESGIRNSSFETQESIVHALSTQFRDRAGMSERTLWAKFAAAKRHLDES